MASPEEEAAAVRLGLRIAFTATACLVVSEWLQLGQRSLSVFTAHLAMVLFPFSAFQKALERIAGRVLGVAYGLALVELLGDAPLLLLCLTMLAQIVFFYVYSSGRLAYGALMGGLFLGVIVEIGITAPPSAQAYAVSLVEQLILATVMIFVVNWVTGAERTLTIEVQGEPLWPLRTDWLNKSAMVSTGQIAAMLIAIWLDLPALPTLISATILGITATDPRAMGWKAYLRVLGAVLGGGYALAAMILLAYLPYLPVLLALVFIGMFVAAYYTKVSVDYSYAFMQMGLAMPMVLIGSTDEIGSFSTAIQRMIGVGAGLFIAEVVFLCWPHPAASAPAAAPSTPTEPASAEVVRPGG
jgi:uncharacterized membrane protein YccC